MKEKILRFVAKGQDIRELFDRFHPGGQVVLNRSEWRGKEPRSCGILKTKGRPKTVGDPSPFVVDVGVVYRPKGCITYSGTTKYDGWTAMMLDRAKDGTLLDGHGQPLKEGNPPAYLPFEMYHDVEFNDINFGEFIEEVDAPGVKRETYDDVIKEIHDSGKFNMSVHGAFVAPHRHRPLTKIILSNAPSGEARDGFGTRIINVNNSTPYLEQVLLDKLTDLISDFIEGKASINCLFNDDLVMVELGASLVDCTPNEQGMDSWFDVLKNYVPLDFLELLAKRLMAVYEIDVSVVEKKGGLVLRRSRTRKDQT